MSRRIALLVGVIALFGTLSGVALWKVGYFGILLPHFKSWGAGQVLADLVIMCTLGCVWMVQDARERRLKAWPFVLVTLAAGSFGPLAYLAYREFRGVKD